MTSTISFPNRGPWGDSGWRGNASGHVTRELIEHFELKPNQHLFVDVCEGSGTSGDVCRDLGIDYVGLDLHKGQDFTKDSVLASLDRPGDIVYSHFPYHDMIKYSSGVYGNEILPGDTSHCKSVGEFLAMSQIGLLNQREATKEGGIYTTLIGDQRGGSLKGDVSVGNFASYQADFINMMPKSELFAVVIKHQHNTVSGRKTYANKNFIAIEHEYLLIWRKTKKTLMQVSFDMATAHQRLVATTWRNAIRMAMISLGGKATLKDIYAEVEKVPGVGKLIANNQNYKAKIRQTMQKHYQNVERGVWAVA